MPDDIHMTLLISMQEARPGPTPILTLPDARQITIAVPAGGYTGQLLQFPGQGKPASGSQRGGLLLTIQMHAGPEEEVSTLLAPPPQETVPAPPSMPPPLTQTVLAQEPPLPPAEAYWRPDSYQMESPSPRALSSGQRTTMLRRCVPLVLVVALILGGSILVFTSVRSP